MNANPITDANDRKRALEPHSSFIVQAPAGSGKTELLAQRFLALLGMAEMPEEIVALTFTRKAAGEMHARIMQALESSAAKPCPAEEHKRLTWELARRVLQQDSKKGWRLLENPSRLQIQTIDSLCGSLVRRMPWLSLFGAPAEIVDEASEFYRRAARQAILSLEGGRWSSDVACLLKHLDNDPSRLESLLAGMLGRRDQWIRLLTAIGDTKDWRPYLEECLKNSIISELETLRASVPLECEDGLIRLAAYAASNVEDDSPLKICRDLRDIPGTSLDELSKWNAVRELLLTDKGTWRRKVEERNGFPAQSRGRDKSEKEFFAQKKDEFKELADFLAQHGEPFRRHLRDSRDLPLSEKYADAQWEVIQSLKGLLTEALAQLRVAFSEAGKTDFSEVALRADLALGTEENPTDLAYALDCKLRHLLVDEFQDTSYSQFRLLEKLTSGWTRGDGRTLFLVGDPMQSIYRFREAEVGLFLQAQNSGIGQLRLERLSLEVNFRSEQGIVEWVNDNFRSILPLEEDIFTGAVKFSPSTAFYPAGAGEAVELHPLINAGADVQAERVAAIIKEAKARARDEKIAILVRTRTHLASILPALQREGIHFKGIEISSLASLPVIQDLRALTRALLHFGDRVSWLALLRAPWCGLSLADLHTLAGNDRQSTVWSLMEDRERLSRLSLDGKQRVQRLREVVTQRLAERSQASLRQWVECAWIALGGPACLEEKSALENAAVFFDLLEKLDTGGDLLDFDLLDEKVEKLYAQPDREADESVQLMTIHKAKGLEFDTVIIPSLNSFPQADATQLMLWLERQTEAGSDLLIGAITEKGEETDPIYHYLKAIHRKKEEHETGRLLYVAATRAKKKLHLLGSVKLADPAKPGNMKPHSRTLLEKLWPGAEPKFKEAAEAPSPVPAEDASTVPSLPEHVDQQKLRRLPLTWKLPPLAGQLAWRAASETEEGEEEEKPESRIHYRWAGESARHVGTVVHAAIEQIARRGLENFNPAGIATLRPQFDWQLKQLGVPEEKVAGALKQVEEALAGVLADERGQWILSNRHAQAACEQSLTGIVDGRIVSITIDRTFVDKNGTRWIVDYKSSTHEGGGLDLFLDHQQERYRPQLERYAKFFAAENRPIRLCLYFPLLRASREWDYEKMESG